MVMRSTALFDEHPDIAVTPVPDGIPRPALNEPAPLSYAQERLWFLHQLEPESNAYNVPVLLRVNCALDVDSLTRSIEELLRRHDALRTRFDLVEGQPVQTILPPSHVQLRVEDLRHLPIAEREQRGIARAKEESRKPFDLRRGPLFRVHCWRLQDEEYLLLFTLHHIVSDGWSVGILLRELTVLYDAFAQGLPSPLQEPALRYADAALRQRELLRGETLQRHLEFWKEQLRGAPDLLDLPFDHPRLPVQSMRGGSHEVSIPARIADDLRKFSRKEGATVFMTLLAAFQTLLYRYTGQPDFLLGVPVAGRVRVDTEGIVGFFVNTLPLRADFSDDPPFAELLKRVRATSLGCFDHQDLPFERLVEELRPERSARFNPMIQAMFAFENVPMPAMGRSGLKLTPLLLQNETAKFDLSLTLYEENGFSGYLEYASDLFDPDTVARMEGHFLTLLRGILDNPQERVSRLPLLTNAERATTAAVPTGPTAKPGEILVHRLFEHQAVVQPDAIAVESGSSRTSYRELNRLANILARRLRDAGVGPGAVVGVSMDRSTEAVIALLAILKAGGTYLPLDPELPRERLEFMFEETRPTVLLTAPSLHSRLPATGVPVFDVGAEAEEISSAESGNCTGEPGAGDLAYIMYTAGSTGTPKGVEITQGAIGSHCIDCRNLYALSPSDRVLQFSSLAADVSLEQVFSALVSGSTLVLRDREVWNAEEFTAKLRDLRLTVVNLPTAYWHHLVRGWVESPQSCNPHGLRLMIVGGEAMLPEVLASWRKTPMNGVRLLNAYGPTETTITATVYEIPAPGPDAGPEPRVAIGMPIGNRTAYVLDDNLLPVPRGVVGELVLGGDNVGRGYFARPDLTAAAFIPDPWGPGSRMYRTGDLVRSLPGGALEFMGRKDQQVKIRGYRIELGEIETALARHPSVREGLVIAHREQGRDEHQLIAYVVWNKGAPADIAALRTFLSDELPGYMVPAIIVPLESIPLTPTGKVDRHALPVPQGPQGQREFVAPRDLLEKQLSNLWERLFNIRPLGITENFFELGGHSLLAVRLFSQIEKLTGRNLPLVTLFQAPTIERLAGILRQQGWEPPWSSLVPLKGGGSKAPFYCVHGVGGNILEFEHFSRYFDPDRPLYGIQAQGLDGKRPRHNSVEEMALHYIKEIREFQPEGPYYLGGCSFGGLVAFEIAQRLVSAGEQVGLLAMFDTNAPGYPRYLPATTSLRRRWNNLKFRFALHWQNIKVADSAVRWEYVYAKTGRFFRQYRAKSLRNIRGVTDSVKSLFLPRTLRHVSKGGQTANSRYEPKPYPGSVTLFRATEQPYGIYPDPTNGWSRFVGERVEIHHIPGHHGAIVREPRARILVQTLTACLDSAEHAARRDANDDQKGIREWKAT
jgi:aspartate racemase